MFHTFSSFAHDDKANTQKPTYRAMIKLMSFQHIRMQEQVSHLSKPQMGQLSYLLGQSDKPGHGRI